MEDDYEYTQVNFFICLRLLDWGIGQPTACSLNGGKDDVNQAARKTGCRVFTGD